MKIITRIAIIGSVLALSGCMRHSGYLGGHSYGGSYGVSVNSYTPFRHYPAYRDYHHDHDKYKHKPHRGHHNKHYNKHHYNDDYATRPKHYSHNNHSGHSYNKHPRNKHNRHSRGHSYRKW